MHRSMPLPSRWPRVLSLRRDALLGGIALAVVVGLGLATGGAPLPLGGSPADTIPTSPAIEARWGIRISHVAVTADGGLVEVRFLVLDGDKAVAMMQGQTNLPVLQVEGSGAVVNSAALMSGRHSIAPGRSSFLLYRNTGGAIRPGSLVTLVFGDLRLEHVVAL